MIDTHELKKRDLYLNKIIAFQDTEPVKVVTGIRRCGKSSLLKLMTLHLKETGIIDDQILEMNFESHNFKNMTSDSFYEYVRQHIQPDKRMYLFFDEVQRIPNWEDAINSFRVDFNCDIYVTGSNAYMLSSEYATYLSGRCVEIKMLPLSFSEFLTFHDFGLDQEKALVLLEGIYSTVIMRDILERENRRGQKRITDPVLLKKIVMFLADNIGSSISVSSIGNTLVNEGLLEDGRRKGTPSVHTVQAYVTALLEAYFFYDIKRFDIKGKEFLRTLGKYYIVDIGLRNYLLGFRDRDSGHAIENVVYFELLRRGYDVSIGKVDNSEVDFIATKVDDKLYVQVTESMTSEDVRKRELAPLQKISDNYEKIVLSLNTGMDSSYDGIKSINLIDWLISE